MNTIPMIIVGLASVAAYCVGNWFYGLYLMLKASIDFTDRQSAIYDRIELNMFHHGLCAILATIGVGLLLIR